MPNRSYARSTAKENWLKNYLEKRGWTAIRSAGSHGPIDVLAGRSAWDADGNPPWSFRRVAVQVKTGSASFSDRDKEIVMSAANQFQATPMLFRNIRGKGDEFWVLDSTDDEMVDPEVFFK